MLRENWWTITTITRSLSLHEITQLFLYKNYKCYYYIISFHLQGNVDEYELRILIHQSLAGCVIGKAGAKIKELKDVSTIFFVPFMLICLVNLKTVEQKERGGIITIYLTSYCLCMSVCVPRVNYWCTKWLLLSTFFMSWQHIFVNIHEYKC